MRQILHWELRLCTELAVSEAATVAPLVTNLSHKENLTSSLAGMEINKGIEKVFRSEMRRAIVHATVLLGGKGNIKQIKHELEDTDIYTESEFFEEELLVVAS